MEDTTPKTEEETREERNNRVNKAVNSNVDRYSTTGMSWDLQRIVANTHMLSETLRRIPYDVRESMLYYMAGQLDTFNRAPTYNRDPMEDDE